MTIKEALEHPWVKMHERIDIEVGLKPEIKKQMSDFQKYTHVVTDSDIIDENGIINSCNLGKAKTEVSLLSQNNK